MLIKDQDEYLRGADALLLTTYGISLEDTGYDLVEWLQRFGDQTIEMAVSEFAIKYDLEPLPKKCALPHPNLG